MVSRVKLALNTCIFFLVFGILSRIHDAHSDYLMTFLIISYQGIKIPLAFDLILDLHENLKCCSTAVGNGQIRDNWWKSCCLFILFSLTSASFTSWSEKKDKKRKKFAWVVFDHIFWLLFMFWFVLVEFSWAHWQCLT